MKYISLCLILLLFMPLGAVNVGGWINEDTVWTLDNSPYVVESYLYVAEDVTLSIEPGVEVLVKGGYIVGDQTDFQWTGTSDDPIEPVAKRIIVHGRIDAQGSPISPIIFDVFESGIHYRWSGIEFMTDAPESEFKHCQIKHTYLFYPYQSSHPVYGALIYRNGKVNIRYCEFINNRGAIGTFQPGIQEDTVIYGCKFSTDNYVEPAYHISVGSSVIPEPRLTIARCEFRGRGLTPSCSGVKLYMLFNQYINYTESDSRTDEMPRLTFQRSFYGNQSVNSRVILVLSNTVEPDTVFFRRNKIIYDNTSGSFSKLVIQPSYPLPAVFSDNYVRGNVKSNFISNTQVFNNVFETSVNNDWAFLVGGSIPAYPIEPRIYNNLIRNNYTDSANGAFSLGMNTSKIFNNDIINYIIVAGGDTNATPIYINNIFDGYSYPTWPGSLESLVFYNNCLEMPFPYEPYPYDGGGNIIAAPLYADSLGGDFSLQEGSPCIDAGLNIPELPAFDIRYHKRVASGTPTGPQTVDMGAYEYNSVYIGGIRGYVYDAASFAPLDCARIDIDGRLPEFSDQNGRFPFPTGAGTYTLRVSRWDYEDLIIPNVVVTEGEDIRVNFAMNSLTTASGDVTNPPVGDQLALMNYPNPFRQETRIGFVLSEMGPVRLTVYNLRGQKIRSLADLSLAKGHHSLTWDGKDDSGRSASQGIYFIRLDNGSRHAMRKMVLMR